MTNNIVFISYSGVYPHLCIGLLIIKVNNKVYELEDALCSGGRCYFNNNGDGIIEKDDWLLKNRKYKEDIEYVINDNIEKGCCGGCL